MCRLINLSPTIVEMNKFKFFRDYMVKYRGRTLTAKFVFKILVNYFGIDFEREEQDFLLVLDEFEIYVDVVDRQLGHMYYNMLMKPRKKRQHKEIRTHLQAHNKAFKI
jgi:uncharacterized protein (DUF2164 family)